MSTNCNNVSGPNPSPKRSISDHDKGELKQVFDRLDANGDCKISAQELAGVLNALGSTATFEDEWRRIMAEVDADKDGFISLPEFAAFFSAGSAGYNSPELHDAFDMYDHDKNGLISASELHLM